MELHRLHRQQKSLIPGINIFKEILIRSFFFISADSKKKKEGIVLMEDKERGADSNNNPRHGSY